MERGKAGSSECVVSRLQQQHTKRLCSVVLATAVLSSPARQEFTHCCTLAHKFPHLSTGQLKQSQLPPHRATDSTVTYSESLAYRATLGGAFDCAISC